MSAPATALGKGDHFSLFSLPRKLWIEMSALEKKFLELSWKQHPDKYPRYPLNQFIQDWGAGGQWGIIKSYKVNGASTCGSGASGVVVDVIVNDRAEHAQLWVEKSDKTLSPPPCELLFR